MSLPELYECLGRCSSCPDHTRRLVHGDGPVPSEVMLIGEAPGASEDSGGRPFIGRSGMELNDNYLVRMGLNRSVVYFTNSVKCRPDKNKKPGKVLKTTCSTHFLQHEVDEVKPKIILLFGATAASLLPTLDINLERDHGFPIWVEPGQAGLIHPTWSGWVIPFYHPAAGMHNTDLMAPLVEDSNLIGEWIQERWEPPVDEFPDRDYQLVTTAREMLSLLDESLHISIDTENDSQGKLFSGQWSQFPGTGYMFLAEHKNIMRLYIDFINSLTNDQWVIAQNATHDYDQLYQYGLRLKPGQIQDTMQRAFQLGNVPQGLKAMSKRLVGVTMRSFESVCRDPSTIPLMEWHDKLRIWDEGVNMPKASIQTVNGEPTIVYTPAPTKRTKSINNIREYMNDPETRTKAFKKSQEFVKKHREVIDSRTDSDLRQVLTNPPRLGFEHAFKYDRESAIFYACQDPDLTLRCFFKLEERIQRWSGSLNVKDMTPERRADKVIRTFHNNFPRDPWADKKVREAV